MPSQDLTRQQQLNLLAMQLMQQPSGMLASPPPMSGDAGALSRAAALPVPMLPAAPAMMPNGIVGTGGEGAAQALANRAYMNADQTSYRNAASPVYSFFTGQGATDDARKQKALDAMMQLSGQTGYAPQFNN